MKKPDLSILYHRNIENIDEICADLQTFENVSNFVDTKQGNVDTQAQNSLQNLKEDLEEIKKNKSYDVIWSPETGIETENYTEYLENFCNEFIEDAKQAILEKLSNVMVEKNSVDNENSSNYEEIFHHLRFAEHKSSMFFGREDLIGTILSKISEDMK